ncbi:cytochrome P450 [Amanita rubescens]|nr:cytochrome P450 [Amanita rubescens]
MLTIARVFLALAVYPLYKLTKYLYQEYNSPLKHLPGPKSTSWIYGNFKEIWESDNSVAHEKWISIYGTTFKYKGFFGITRLFTMDAKALSHILMNSSLYEKPEIARYALTRLLGDGLLVAEGDKHRQQRRIMNPAFGAAQIRELTGIFIDKAVELRDALEAEIMRQKGPLGPIAYINILPWLSKMTLDVIGLAGFNYQFNALSEDTPSGVCDSFQPETRMPLIPIIRGMVPALRFLAPDRDAEIAGAKQTMTRIGHELLEDSRASVMSEKSSSFAKDSWKGPNMATDLPSSQRMCDDDVVAQVPTFLVAGHETTSVATTWALFALTKRPDVQERLRVELLNVSTENPTMDQLNALPYLDAVVRETMRLHPPVPSTLRVANQDDVIPLEKPVTDEKGNIHEYIRVKKGQTIFIPILTVHRAVNIWGEDAAEFKPERWESIPQAAHSIPGVWGNLLTFLGGPRACIGYKFSVVEMKALLFTLIRAFEFQLAVPAANIKGKTSVVQRPIVTSDPSGKNQLPLLIKVHQQP